MARSINRKLEQQQAPAFFVQGPTALARLLLFATLSIILITIDSRLQYLVSLRQHLVALMHPLQLLANTPSQLWNSAGEYFSTHHRLLEENQQLKQQALKQSITLQKFNTLTLENTHLRELLHTNQAIAQQSVVGEIMHVGQDLFTKKVMVDRGEDHHIRAGEAVVDATGVIGQVTRVFSSSSEVTLITDKSLAIPIQIERNGLRAIAFGHGRDNTLNLPYLPTNVDIRRDDILVTSGIDGIYPAGLVVAKVFKIEVSANSPFAQIICVPTGGVDKHRQVLLVSTPQLEPPPLLDKLPNMDKKNSLKQKNAGSNNVLTPSLDKKSTAVPLSTAKKQPMNLPPEAIKDNTILKNSKKNNENPADKIKPNALQ